MTFWRWQQIFAMSMKVINFLKLWLHPVKKREKFPCSLLLWCGHKDCIDNLYHFTAHRSRYFDRNLFSAIFNFLAAAPQQIVSITCENATEFFPQLRWCKKKLAGDGSGCAVRFCAKTCSPFVFSLFTSSRSTQSQNCAVNAQVVEQVAAYQRFSYEIYYRFASNVADWLLRKAKETPARMLIICCAHVGVKKWTLGDW